MKMYVVRKYHGHASWIDPKHLAEYTETEFEQDMKHLLIVRN